MLDKPLVIVDVETSGKDPDTCSIIQIGAVSFTREGYAGNPLMGYSQHIIPYTDVWEEEAEKVHKMSKSFVSGVGMPLEYVLQDLESYFGDPKKYCLATWSATFDIECLQKAYKNAGRVYPFNYRSYDIASFTRLFLAGMGHLPKDRTGLTRCMNAINLKPYGLRHDALNDAVDTSRVLEKLYHRARAFRLLEEGYIHD